EEEVVELAALPVNIEGGVAAAVGGVLEDVAADAGDQCGEVGVGAAVERKILNLASADHLASFTVFGFEQRSAGTDGDGLCGGADLESDVDPLAGIDGNGKRLGSAGIKTAGLRRNLILANLYVGKFIGTLRVTLDRDLGFGFLIHQGDGCAR